MSPSRRRREGREAFDPQTDPYDINPYTEGSLSGSYDDWMQGWISAAKDYEVEQAEKQEDKDDWEAKSQDCPWKYADICNSVSGVCSYATCAPWYFG